jgi:uncharacterized membrane protein YdjX (TVP38/TMEM64 family)
MLQQVLGGAGKMPEASRNAATFPALRRFLPAIGVVGVLAAAWAFGWLDKLSLSYLIANRAWLAGQVEANFVLALAAYLAVYAALVAISFPGASLLTITAGFVFGGLVAGVATVFSATAGAAIIFLVVRSGFGDFLTRKAGPFAARMAEGFNHDAFNYLLTLRLMPVFPFWVVNIVPALFGMRLGPYLLATLLGIIPGTFAYAYVGSGLDSVVAAQEAADPGCVAAMTCKIDVSALLTPQILAAMFALAAISILPIVYRKLRKSN